MKIWPLSDLHMELTRGWDLPGAADRPPFDVMVVAGDVMPGFARGVRWLAERVVDRPVIMVAGNHEHYGRDLDREIEKAREAATGTNVTVLQNSTAIVNGVLFLGATYWTDFDLFGTPIASMSVAAEMLNDYRKIRVDNYSRRLRPQHTLLRHRESRAFVEETLRAAPATMKRVLVTHHPVHPVGGRSRPHGHDLAGDQLAPAYMSDCSELFELGLDAAVSGHTHVSLDEIVGKTRLISNSKGYGPWTAGERWENPHFDPLFTFDI
ncbi:metallophosphoesterase [Rhodopseudomonas palustris BisB5]|uniref:Metallophosphoesterase n=1 Tax=Rhodopseudomonas palustris (strain BisB5) TaxID=316057 RepID=Q132W2_RHOPS|nr:metallophosphoesterase [Rhodopseudomonas palustris BisB5]